MITLADALAAYLTGNPTLGAAGARVFQDELDQGTPRPAILIIDPDETGGHHQTGADGLVEARLQVEAWSYSKPEAAEVRNALRELLDGFPRGELGADGRTIDVEGIHLENRYLQEEPPDDGSDRPEFRGILDLKIWYRETVPEFD